MTSTVKIAWYLALHRDIDQAARLLEVLHSAGDIFLIHLDRKSSDADARRLEAMVQGLSNVTLLERQPVYWGDWSQCRAELTAIKQALSAGCRWDYFINLSGQCFPLHPLARLRHYLSQNPGVNYIELLPFDGLPAKTQRHILRRYINLNAVQYKIFGRLLAPLRLPVSLPAPRRFKFRWKGSQWHALSRPFCEWTVTDPLAMEIARYCKWLFVPDESFFQALIMNSPFRDTLKDHLHCIEWAAGRPVNINLPLAEQFRQHEGKFFARKFDSIESAQALQFLYNIIQASRN